jgi:hypothetical protein
VGHRALRRFYQRFHTSFIPYERTGVAEQAVAEIMDRAALTQFRLSHEEFLSSQNANLTAEFDELDNLYGAVLLLK